MPTSPRSWSRANDLSDLASASPPSRSRPRHVATATATDYLTKAREPRRVSGSANAGTESRPRHGSSRQHRARARNNVILGNDAG